MKIAGKPVVDANTRLKITILPADVKKGSNRDPGACAAALAIMRSCGAKAARVHLGRTYIDMGRQWVRYQTPAALRTEVVTFDRAKKFQVGEYVLRPTSPAARAAIGKRYGATDKTDREARRKIAKRISHVVTGVRQHGAAR